MPALSYIDRIYRPFPPPPVNLPSSVQIVKCYADIARSQPPPTARPAPSSLATVPIGLTQDLRFCLTKNDVHYLGIQDVMQVSFTSGHWYFLLDKEESLGLFFCVGVENTSYYYQLKMKGWLTSDYDVFTSPGAWDGTFVARDFLVSYKATKDGNIRHLRTPCF